MKDSKVNRSRGIIRKVVKKCIEKYPDLNWVLTKYSLIVWSILLNPLSEKMLLFLLLFVIIL